MAIPKVSSYFTKVEDKYVFRISTAFWHILIGILTLAAVIGILMFFWSVIPPGKGDIKTAQYPAKPIYPTLKKVRLADLHLTEKNPQPVENIDTIPREVDKPKVEIKTVYDPDKPAYDLALAEFKKIIPDEQWNPGKFEITNQMGWDLYHSEKYRRWVTTGRSIEDYLDNIYRVVGANNYNLKKKTLKAITKVVKAASSDSKGKTVDYISSSINSNWTETKLLDSLCTMIGKSLKTFNGKNATNAVRNIVQFSFNNRNVAFVFTPFAVKTCNQVSDSLRFSLLAVLISSYYNYFPENFAAQKEATEQFNELIPQLGGFDPARVLNKFYSVYNLENSQRTDTITRLNNEYYAQVNAIVADSTRQAMQNQEIYREKKEKKSELRWKSLGAIGIGLVAIALFGTILTLLSIQRILKRIEVVAEKVKI